jgi:hypothetical protein
MTVPDMKGVYFDPHHVRARRDPDGGRITRMMGIDTSV